VAQGKQLSLVSTDGHRLAFASATLETDVPNKQEVILPRKTVLELHKDIFINLKKRTCLSGTFVSI
jgi:DNA polymerase-3 subunit beta